MTSRGGELSGSASRKSVEKPASSVLKQKDLPINAAEHGVYVSPIMADQLGYVAQNQMYAAMLSRPGANMLGTSASAGSTSWPMHGSSPLLGDAMTMYSTMSPYGYMLPPWFGGGGENVHHHMPGLTPSMDPAMRFLPAFPGMQAITPAGAHKESIPVSNLGRHAARDATRVNQPASQEPRSSRSTSPGKSPPPGVTAAGRKRRLRPKTVVIDLATVASEHDAEATPPAAKRPDHPATTTPPASSTNPSPEHMAPQSEQDTLAEQPSVAHMDAKQAEGAANTRMTRGRSARRPPKVVQEVSITLKGNDAVFRRPVVPPEVARRLALEACARARVAAETAQTGLLPAEEDNLSIVSSPDEDETALEQGRDSLLEMCKVAEAVGSEMRSPRSGAGTEILTETKSVGGVTNSSGLSKSSSGTTQVLAAPVGMIGYNIPVAIPPTADSAAPGVASVDSHKAADT